MNPDLDKLHPYPFEKLANLKAGITPPDGLNHIPLSIGEPKHKPAQFVNKLLNNNLGLNSRYPTIKGDLGLRNAIANWLCSRFSLPQNSIDPETSVIPVSGTREALFSFAQCVVDPNTKPLVLMPNPFYQIYEGAALLAGAQAYYLNTTEKTGFLPDLHSVPAEVWARCQLIYLCSPGNPTGKIVTKATLQTLLELADKYDFIVASDECYSEIYFDEKSPPLGLLEIAHKLGRKNFSRCIVFHSLSKRSNVPGLRSGFVAGDPTILKKYLLYRTYHGCAMPGMIQAASAGLWSDEQHVIENRNLYRTKFDTVLNILSPYLPVKKPDASFYLWLKTPINDTEFTRELYLKQNITVLPGSYLSRDAHGINPGTNYVRMALVSSIDDCKEAAVRISRFVNNL